MSDKALSSLTDGGDVQAGDIGYVVRGGNSRRVNLGEKQPLDATLTALAAFNTSGLLTQTAVDTFTGRTITGTANKIEVTNGDGIAGNPTIDLPDAVTLATSLTNPLLIGGAAAGSTLTLKSTTGVGATDAIIFQVGNNGATEAARIDSDGNTTLWGAETAGTPIFNATPLQVHVGSISDVNAAFFYWFNDGFGPGHLFIKSRGGVGSTTIVQSGDSLGRLSFSGADGSAFREAASIFAFVDGTPGSNDMPGALVFYTTADGAGSPTERMRINSAGDVGIAASPSGQLHVDQVATDGAQPVLYLDQADVDQPFATLATTIGTGNAIEAVGAKTLTTTHFVMVNVVGVGNRYFPVGTIA